MRLKIGFTRALDRKSLMQTSVPPLGIGYIVAHLKQKFPQLEYRYYHFVEEILEDKPQLLGIASASENFEDARELARTVKKELNIPIIIGESHITTLPHTLPSEFDIGVLGEGEVTTGELIQAFLNASLEPQELKKIKGICFHHHGNVEITPPRPLIENLDTLPFPDRELFGSHWALSPHEMLHVIHSRGCPYRCAFCAPSRIWGKKVRFFSPEYVVRELEYLCHRYDPDDIYIFDDIFITSRPRLHELHSLMRERGLHQGLFYHCSARVNMFDEKVAEILRDLNIIYVRFGFESHSPNVLEFLGKGTSPELNERAYEILEKSELYAAASLIVATPPETPEDIDTIKSFLERHRSRTDFVGIWPLIPLPGTPVWDYAQERGLVSETMDWSRLQFDGDAPDFHHFPYMGEQLSAEEFLPYYQRLRHLENELNHEGALRYYKRKLDQRRDQADRQLQELQTLKGSRLVKIALFFRQLLSPFR